MVMKSAIFVWHPGPLQTWTLLAPYCYTDTAQMKTLHHPEVKSNENQKSNQMEYAVYSYPNS